MAKKYTQAEWARIQSKLPEEDRVPYSESPEKPVEPTAEEKRQARMDELKAEREARAAEEARQRAASDPMLDPTNRPEAPPPDDENVYYYGWIGGVTSGRWKLYKEKNTAPKEKVDIALERSTAGQTQASFSSAVGANFVPEPTTEPGNVNGAAAGVNLANIPQGTGVAQAIDFIVKNSGFDAQSAIDKVIEYAKSIPASQRGGKTLPDGTFVPYDDKVMVEGALQQLLFSARNNTFIGQDLRNLLLGTNENISMEETFARQRAGQARIIQSRPELWAYKQSDIGKVVQGPEGPRLIVDPNATSLTPEQIKIIKDSNGEITPFNAATGYGMGYESTTWRLWPTVDEAPTSIQWGVDAQGNPVPISQTSAFKGPFTGGPGAISQGGNQVVSKVDSGNGTSTIKYSNGSTAVVNNTTGSVISSTGGTPGSTPSGTGGTPGSTPSGTGGAAAQPIDYLGNAERKSAYDLLYQQMAQYGLQSLVEPLKGLITANISPSEFTLRLRDTPAYKQRFGANQARINKGLRALSEAEYIGLEDQYQDVMRRYGLPENYYRRGELGRQEGFEKFISLDVSPVELEDRIQTAYNRVFNANAEVQTALRNFYPEITNGDILAYTLDPENTLDKIKRKITAAEIGGAAVQAGLTTNESDAAYLARYGITKEQAQAGYRTISGYLPRAEQLSSIYQKQVEGGPYTQASAEREVFSTPGAAEEERKRQRITSLEQAAFSGSSGLTGGALGRERAGQF